MKHRLDLLWIGYWLSKEKIKNIYLWKVRQLELEIICLDLAYDYIIKNFDDYQKSCLDTNLHKNKDYISDLFTKWLISFYVSKNFESALSKFDRILELDNNNEEALRMKWYCLIKLWSTNEAIKYLEKALKNSPKNLLLYLEIINLFSSTWNIYEVDKYKQLLKQNIPPSGKRKRKR